MFGKGFCYNNFCSKYVFVFYILFCVIELMVLMLYYCYCNYILFFVGDCDDFDKECGKLFILVMCIVFEDIMVKKCLKMCNLCGK